MINTNRFYDKNPLLVLQIAGWSTYLVADLFDHFAKGHYLIVPSLVCSITAFLLTGLCAYLTNRVEDKGKRIQVVVFTMSILLSAAVWHKIWAILHGDAETYAQMAEQFKALATYNLEQWLSTGYYPLFLFIAWSGFFVGSKSFIAHQAQKLLLNEAQLNAKQALLQTLRYQLNPHFLFNVLNNIDVSVLKDDKATAHLMIQHLSSFLRNSLQQGEQSKVTVAEEISVIKDFINIEQARYGDALSVAITVNEECTGAMLPPMLLQPLVENAIKFAWSQTEKGTVDVNVSKGKACLEIAIANSKARDQGVKAGTGTGLKNTQERLTLIYGEDAKLVTTDNVDSYKVQITMPWEVSFS